MICLTLIAIPLNFYEIYAAQSMHQLIKKEVEVSALEDLMREHGVLNRILLVYEEIIKRLEINSPVVATVIYEAAAIIRAFVEDYHEKLEEEYIFSRFTKAHKLTQIIATLLTQHQAGRKLTDIIRNAAQSNVVLAQNKKKIIEAMKTFVHMYRVHEAWEDTIVFPAFHALITPQEYEKLGDIFEDREAALFGKNGFEAIINKVVHLEKKLGIYGLKRVTPI